jgi:hypothetical protein
MVCFKTSNKTGVLAQNLNNSKITGIKKCRKDQGSH